MTPFRRSARAKRPHARPVARRVRANSKNSETTRMRLLSTQTQWATGQGFFHSGSLLDESRRQSVMTYVVDCGAVGSQKPVSREIEALSAHPAYVAGARPLDVVFLTHFDYDHISGVPQLHAMTRPRRYVIPATNRLERLYLAARARTQDVDGNLPSWYWQLLDNPARWLSELDGDPQVIEVVDQTRSNEIDEPPREFYIDDQDSPFDGGPARAFASGRRVRSGQDVAGVIEGPGGGARPGALAWVWRTYVTLIVDSHLVEFEAVLMGTVPGYAARRYDANLVQWLVENHWPALRKAYDASPKVRNLSSLCVYSGPLPDATSSTTYFLGAEYADFQPRPGSGGPGWLGAGDAGLDTDTEAAAFVAAFRDVMPHVGTFAVPHHGARSSWNDLVLAGFKGVPAPTVVVGARPGFRGWEHPSIEVIRAVSDIGSAVRVVTKEESRAGTHRPGSSSSDHSHAR